ncbi:MAG: sugar phosphate nucleotidyltransferase, partial [candidate division WOR-3 bacterium]
KLHIIIPAAGEGRRLKPLTHTTPKSLLAVAGKPIIGHIIERITDLNPERVVVVIGSNQGGLVEKYLTETFHLPFFFAKQENPLGLGDAVYRAKDYVAEDASCLIILGDTILDMNFSEFIKEENLVGVKRVENPRRFGIVELRDGVIARIVEKPQEPKSDLAIVGVYYFTESAPLFRALQTIIEKNIKTKGEYQLSDALELLIEEGLILKAQPVEYWLDCGTPEALIETNRYLLQSNNYYQERKGSVIIPPVYIADSALIEESVIGPFVSISEEAEIRRSIIKDSIINRNATVENSLLAETILGENAVIKEKPLRLNLGDFSLMEFH